MSVRRCVVAAGTVAAALFVVQLCASAEPVGNGGDSARYLLFSGGDIWRKGAFSYGGLLWSPGGLDREGFTLKAVLSGGFYTYNSGALGNTDVTGRELAAQILPGWRFKQGTLEVKLFAGLDLENHRLSPDDPSSGLRGGNVGLRTAAEVWYEPTPLTMIAADGSVSTIIGSYSARAAYGWRLNNKAYVGPEVQTFASDGYRQWRVGAHLTGLKTKDAEWSFGAGFAEDSSHRSGPYVRLGVAARR